MSLKIAYRTDVGLDRDNNEDNFYVDKISGILTVADGMGGKVAGEFASKIAVDSISSLLKSDKSEQQILKAIQKANKEIIDRGEKNPEMAGMGTTVVLAVFQNDSVDISWVGDSRAYLIKDKIIGKTEDHSLVMQLLKKGEITKEKARKHPLRHVVTRALGSKDATPDMIRFSWEKGSCLLLCSDGLTDMVEDKMIEKIVLNKESLQSKVDMLVKMAKDGGGKDNITVILARED